MAFDVNQTWLGIGEKTGGMLFVVGFEGTEGQVWSMSNTNISYGFSCLAPKLGLGLGGGIGLVALCIFNCNNPRTQLHNTNLNDWGVNVAIGGKWSTIAKALKGARFYAKIASIGAKARHLKHVDDIRNDLHYLYNALDIASAGPEPKVVSLDLPVAAGLELSASYSLGKIEIS